MSLVMNDVSSSTYVMWFLKNYFVAECTCIACIMGHLLIVRVIIVTRIKLALMT